MSQGDALSSGRLDELVAVVTGGARGIGAAIAQYLSGLGAAVGIVDLDEAVARETAAGLPGRAAYTVADCGHEKHLADALAALTQELGGLDIMVNNAGARGMDPIVQDGPPVPPLVNLTVESWDAQLANNLRTTFLGAKLAIPYIEARGGGSIVNIASIAGLLATPSLPAYGAAKAGVIQFSRTLAIELAEKDIRVNAVCPGLLYTRAWEDLTAAMQRDDPELRAVPQRDIFLGIVQETVPLGREQTPEDIAHLVGFLVSDLGRNVTGQSISVDGGITAKGGG